MGTKFKINKNEAAELAERNSSLIPSIKFPSPDRATKLKKGKDEDWSNKTVASWNDHTEFLERTAVTGIRPPPSVHLRGVDPSFAAPLPVLECAQPDNGSISISDRRKIGLCVLLSVLAGSLFFGALNGDNPADLTLVGIGEASASDGSDLPEPPPPKIAKNPYKGRARPEPIEIKLARLEANLRPPIKFSTQPTGVLQKPAVPRESSVIALDAAEITRIRDLAKRQLSLKRLVQNWRAQAARDSLQPPQVIATFIETKPTDMQAVNAKIGLQKLRDLTMAAVASGDAAIIRRLATTVLMWSQAYRPLGNADSDVELAPVIEAYAFLQPNFQPEQMRAIDNWLYLMADREISELDRHPKTNDLYYARHLKTMALIGFATGNANMQNYVAINLPMHLTVAIESDGSTTTYQETQSIRKHSEHVQALLQVSALLNRANLHTPESLPRLGTPFAKSIDFAYPYLIGNMAHREFQSAKLALEPEHPLNPQSALGFLDTALYFRMRLFPEVRRLVGQPHAMVWDSQSLYFSSMSRKTDDFEVRMVSPTTFRAPAAVRKSL